MLYDSGRYAENMGWAMRLADWPGFGRASPRPGPGTAGGPRASPTTSSSRLAHQTKQTRITVRPEGRVEVVIGTQSAGRATRRASRRWCRSLLECRSRRSASCSATPISWVGGGSHSGRSMRMRRPSSPRPRSIWLRGASASRPPFGKAADQIAYTDGRFTVLGTDWGIGFFELAPRDRPAHAARRPQGQLRSSPPTKCTSRYSNGCHVCEVEVDPDTGAVNLSVYASVDDVGRSINPLIVDGQTHGAVVQGVGQAIWEQCVVEAPPASRSSAR